jgi:hypothetical protein
MARHHDRNAHFFGALHHRVEVVHFEPEQHSVAVRLVGRVGDRPVMVFDAKAVELQNQLAVVHQLFVLLAAVRALASEQTLIPAAARFNVRHANQWLRSHNRQRSRTRSQWHSHKTANAHVTTTVSPCPTPCSIFSVKCFASSIFTVPYGFTGFSGAVDGGTLTAAGGVLPSAFTVRGSGVATPFARVTTLNPPS